MGTVHDQLKALRSEAGLTMAEMAKVLGLKSSSAYAYYENPESYRRTTWNAKLLAAVIRAQKAGDLKVSHERLVEIVGVETIEGHAEDAALASGEAVVLHRIAAERDRKGSQVLTTIQGMIFDADTLAAITTADADNLLVVNLHGDPELFPPSQVADYLIIDRSITRVSEAGIYAFTNREYGLHFLEIQRDVETGQWVMLPVSMFKDWDIADRFEIPKTHFVPVYGQVIWRARSLRPFNAAYSTRKRPPK